MEASHQPTRSAPPFEQTALDNKTPKLKRKAPECSLRAHFGTDPARVENEPERAISEKGANKGDSTHTKNSDVPLKRQNEASAQHPGSKVSSSEGRTEELSSENAVEVEQNRNSMTEDPDQTQLPAEEEGRSKPYFGDDDGAYTPEEIEKGHTMFVIWKGTGY